MPRRSIIPSCSQEDLATLIAWSRSKTMEARLVERANIILSCIQGEPVSQIARRLRVRPNTVIDWRRRFEREGMKGLLDRSRPGKPLQYGADFRKQVLELLEQSPPEGQANWDGPAVADRLKTSTHAVWRVLRKEGICLSRQRSWCVPIPAFAAPPTCNTMRWRSDLAMMRRHHQRTLDPPRPRGSPEILLPRPARNWWPLRI